MSWIYVHGLNSEVSVACITCIGITFFVFVFIFELDLEMEHLYFVLCTLGILVGVDVLKGKTFVLASLYLRFNEPSH